MILIALGSNLSQAPYTSPRDVLEAALEKFPTRGITVVKASRWYETEPVPKSDQPWFVNGVALVESDLSPEALLGALHDLESEMGRLRRERWEARILDLDLLAYDGVIRGEGVVLPHPRLHERAFVLRPLQDVAPGWSHPVLKKTAAELLEECDISAGVRILPERP